MTRSVVGLEMSDEQTPEKSLADMLQEQLRHLPNGRHAIDCLIDASTDWAKGFGSIRGPLDVAALNEAFFDQVRPLLLERFSVNGVTKTGSELLGKALQAPGATLGVFGRIRERVAPQFLSRSRE